MVGVRHGVDTDLGRGYFCDLVDSVTTPPITLADCRIAAQQAFGVTKEQICSKGRGVVRIARARQVAITLGRELTGSSYPTLGWFFDRDWHTVRYDVRRIADLRLRNETVKERYNLARRLAFIVAENRKHATTH